MKVSIITWDASFRESLHTIDSFGEQTNDDIELIWVDFYSSDNEVKNKVSKYPNCRALDLGHVSSELWHLGKCINAGVEVAQGDILIIPDGDIVVDSNFVAAVVSELNEAGDMALYFRRYDEFQNAARCRTELSVKELDKSCILTNPTNYAGCLALHRKLFEKIGGYEEHQAFAGPGINGMETNIRLSNCGAKIKWCDTKIYHPWHASTGSNGHSNTIYQEMVRHAAKYHWLLPYAGVAQSWLVRQRALNLSVRSSKDKCVEILKLLPQELSCYVE